MLQSSCCYLSKVLLQRGMGYAKVIHKKEKKVEKNGQVSKILKNNGYLDACLKKREMNKIVLVLLQKYFQVSKERCDFKEHSRIRLATIYIHHISIHMHILIWLYDSTLFGSEVWLYNICIISMLFHAISTPMSSI